MLSVQKVQNRAARSITRCFDQNVTSESIIKRLGLMTVSERYKYFTSVLVYKGINNMSPEHIRNCFSYANASHDYSTRYAAKNNQNPRQII